LPFDQSAPDVTAHALSALHATAPFDRPVKEAIQRGTAYLARTQRDDGAWLPLWFGNQSTTDGANPVLGTARVLASAPVWAANDPAMLQKGVRYLVSVQNPDGGWGGANAVASTIEETALAVAALASPPSSAGTESAVTRGAEYLCRRLEEDRWGPATPIGLYFAKLWYSEELYRDIWALQALGEILTR
jgi:squalene-hopene/tetraprenyl-beta-curcumene cyclase